MRDDRIQAMEWLDEMGIIMAHPEAADRTSAASGLEEFGFCLATVAAESSIGDTAEPGLQAAS